MFGERVSKKRAALESADVDRFKVWLDKATPDLMHAQCASIDRQLVSKMSGPGMLKIARLIEEKFPDVVQNMPTLKRHLEHLKRTNTMAQVFMPSSLKMLAQALEAEGNP